jgi:Tol biopolymer transport system component
MRLSFGVVLAGAALVFGGSAGAGLPGRNGQVAWATSKLPTTLTIRIGVPGGRPRAITLGRDPEPSPDGNRIVFAADVAGSRHAFTVTAAGRDRRDLGPGLGPRWSPDGKRLLVYVEGSGYTKRFFVVSADGKERRGLGVAGSAAWSPDGTQIAVAGKKALTVLDAATGHVALSLGSGDDPAWSPDGRFIAGDGGVLVTVATGAVRTVAALKQAGAVNLDWQPLK